MPGSGAGPYTSSTINIATASANRRLIVVVDGGLGNPLVASGGITIDDVRTAFTNIAAGGTSNPVNFMTCLAPTGSAGVVDVTFTDTNFATPRVQIYAVDHTLLSNLTPTIGAGDTVGGSTLSAEVTGLAGACVLAAVSFGNGSIKSPLTISAPFTADTDNATTSLSGHANGVSAGTVSATTTWAGNFDASLVLAAYR
ncbi:hypothetical protein HB776_01180 [Tardiphaga robiniae]|uniref:Uncharacterized protein n=1 Tax=Tardiphaga robiniae TaxID=943830 RepID=A0A7G6TTC4_9BRAD|nr:hypothetical protein HB776_01180 [Tardiphaga robiniae]